MVTVGLFVEQKVWVVTPVGADGNEFTVTFTIPELTEQPLFVTTALKYLVAVKFPISADVNVVELEPMLVTLLVNALLFALCHCMAPVALDIEISAGLLPLHIVWFEEIAGWVQVE